MSPAISTLTESVKDKLKSLKIFLTKIFILLIYHLTDLRSVLIVGWSAVRVLTYSYGALADHRKIRVEVSDVVIILNFKNF
jgi:hypothetical protein